MGDQRKRPTRSDLEACIENGPHGVEGWDGEELVEAMARELLEAWPEGVPPKLMLPCLNCGQPEWPEKLSGGSVDVPEGWCRACVLRRLEVPSQSIPGKGEA